MMRKAFGEFTSFEVGRILKYHYKRDHRGMMDDIIRRDQRYGLNDSSFGEEECKIFGSICELIVNRSADLVAALLLGVLQKIKFFQEYRGKWRLREKDKVITIGVDGSVFLKMPRYSERIKSTMIGLVGHHIVDKIQMVHAEDGSGIGAAFCVAALKRELMAKL